MWKVIRNILLVIISIPSKQNEFLKNKFVISIKSFFIPMGFEIQGDRDYETPKIKVRSFRALTRYPTVIRIG